MNHMSSKIKFFQLILILVLFPMLLPAQKYLNIMTYNIRLNIASDSLNGWQYRRDNVSSQVLFHEIHIIGVQEALQNQLIDLTGSLLQYKYIGKGRDNNKDWAEYCAILYDTTRIVMLKTETLWLSEEPTKIGVKGWDAAYPRIVTYGYFKDKKTKNKFYVFNTHFDHKGVVARKESAKLLLAKVESIAGNVPCIVMGDFNAKPADEPIKIILDRENKNHLEDSKTLIYHYGPTGTFNGFKLYEESDEPIDYIFIKNNVSVLQHATISQSWHGRFPSDHFPVFARVQIGK